MNKDVKPTDFRQVYCLEYSNNNELFRFNYTYQDHTYVILLSFPIKKSILLFNLFLFLL